MYITRVTIENFKSYKEKTVVLFEPGLNIIVGLNGCGKSNLLYAIQFVLANEFDHIPTEQLTGMIHHSEKAAYVEIEFNNDDERLPGEKIITIKREISKNKNLFYWNGVRATKSEVLTHLQSAGLSKYNPYYIIKQGRINELAQATDARRLALLLEVAGAMYWDETRHQDIESLKSSTEETERLREVIKEVESNIEVLHVEKEKYDKWQRSEIDKKTIEHVLWAKTLPLLERKLDLEKSEAEEARKELTTVFLKSQQNKDNIRRVELELETTQPLIDEQRRNIEALNKEYKIFNSDFNKAELDLADLKSAIKAEKSDNSITDDLKKLFDEIEAKKVDYQRSVAVFDVAEKVLVDKKKSLGLLKEQLDRMYVLMGKKFTSKEERDKFLVNEMTNLQSEIQTAQQEMENLKKEQKKREEKIKMLKVNIQDCKDMTVKAKEFLETDIADKREKEVNLRKLRLDRELKSREEHEISRKVREAANETKKCFRDLKRVMPSQILEGINDVDEVIGKMREADEGSDDYILATSHYHGLLVDLFTLNANDHGQCPYAIFDAIAGNRLFHHVVETTNEAMKIIEHMKSKNCNGSVNFFPLDSVQGKMLWETPEEYKKNGKDENAMQALTKTALIDPSDKKANVMSEVFANVMICRDRAIASQLSKLTFPFNPNKRFDCITVEGEYYRRSGTITGGYATGEDSKICLYNTYKEAVIIEKSARNDLSEIRERIKVLTTDINATTSELQILQEKITRNPARQYDADIESGNQELSVHEKYLKEIIYRQSQLSASITSYTEKLEKLSADLEQEFSDQATDEQSQQLNDLMKKCSEAQKVYVAASESCLEAERAMTKIQNELENSLLKRRQDLEAQQNEIQKNRIKSQSAGSLEELEEKVAKLKSENEKIKQELQTAEEMERKLVANCRNSKTELETFIDNEKYQNSTKQDIQEKVGRLSTRIDRYTQQIESINDEIRGVSDTHSEMEKELIEEYSKQDKAKLEKRLSQLKAQTKEKARIDPSVDLIREEAFNKTLSSSLEKYETESANCQDLVESVDEKKNHATQLTLTKVANNFRRVFKTFVPHGRGYLKWILKDASDEEDDSSLDDEEETQIPDISQLEGIAVKVAFSGETVLQDLKSLSGGQKSVVSLALIFAIHMVDRSPFNLLDEPDMALDPHYRSGVAKTIARFAKHSQFIATTFRSELLKEAIHFIGVGYNKKTKKSSVETLDRKSAEELIRRGSK